MESTVYLCFITAEPSAILNVIWTTMLALSINRSITFPFSKMGSYVVCPLSILYWCIFFNGPVKSRKRWVSKYAVIACRFL